MSSVVDRVGEENIANNGMKMKIVAYRSAKDVDVQFEDGTIVCNKRYDNFKQGIIKNPNCNTLIDKKIGEKHILSNGEIVEIVDYKGWNNVSVKFSDGTILSGLYYSSIKNGYNIAKRSTKLNRCEDRLGKITLANNGLRMKIIEYRDYHDVDIQFEDGIIVYNKGYKDFKNGRISSSEWSKGKNKEYYNFNNIKKAYKRGREIYYFCKDREGNSHILTPQQMMEKSGVKKVF